MTELVTQINSFNFKFNRPITSEGKIIFYNRLISTDFKFTDNLHATKNDVNTVFNRFLHILINYLELSFPLRKLKNNYNKKTHQVVQF